MRSAILLTTAFAGLLALGACNAPAHRPAAAEPPSGPPAAAAQPDYAPPPRITKVSAGTGGSAVVSGLAAPDSRIRAVTTDQATYGATTGPDGRFVLELPPIGRSRLVAVSMEGPGRSTRATGWLFVPPDAPERAVLLKAGTAAGPLAGAGLIAAVDYDPAGGAALSGRAAPNSPVAVQIDNAPSQEVRTDAAGLWSLRPPAALPAGPHALHVRTSTAREDRTVVLGAHPPAGVFQAVRERDAWRVDWTPPGGGAQTTLVIMGAGAQGAGSS